MHVELAYEDLDTLIESLEYSKRAVRDAVDTPSDVRRQNLARLESVTAKLRLARRSSSAALDDVAPRS
jgi:hypothetical protein